MRISFCNRSFWPLRQRLCVRAVMLGWACLLACSGSAQTSVQPSRVVIPAADSLDIQLDYSVDSFRMRAEAKQLRTLNAIRQKSMVADTNRLVKLVADLNAQINSPSRSPLTSDQMQQLAAIEKLARSIREKMSTSVKEPNSVFMPNPLHQIDPTTNPFGLSPFE